MLELIFFWLAFSILCAVIAPSRGRNWFLVLLAAILFSPVLTLIYILAVPKKRNVDSSSSNESGVDISCPRCAETIKRAAKVCRYCGLNLSSDSLSDRATSAANTPPKMANGGVPQVAESAEAGVSGYAGQDKTQKTLEKASVAAVLFIAIVAIWLIGQDRKKQELSNQAVSVPEDQALPGRLTGSPRVDALITEFNEADTKCKAGTVAACATRDREIGRQLNNIGWCSGDKRQPPTEYTWHLCDAGSRRY